MPQNDISITHQPSAMIETERVRTKKHYIRPAVDFYETEQNLTVVTFMPGVDEKSIIINFEQGVLIIRGDVDVTNHDDSLFREFFQGSSYYRQFEFADEFDAEKISTDLKHGVLTLTFTKSAAITDSDILAAAMGARKKPVSREVTQWFNEG